MHVYIHLPGVVAFVDVVGAVGRKKKYNLDNGDIRDQYIL